jgi:hypothetical protein
MPLAVGSSADCVLTAEHPVHKKVFFKIRVRYCSAENEGFGIGAQVEEVPDASTFNFFRNVYDLIIATVRQD